MIRNGFGDLQNYTTLKQPDDTKGWATSFGDLQNYTTLKPPLHIQKVENKFWRFTELHYSQTPNKI